MNAGIGTEGRGERNRSTACPSDLPDPGSAEDAGEFRGHRHGAAVSIIVISLPPKGGPKLHRRPYKEVFVVQAGTFTFTAGDEETEVRGGQAAVVPAGVAHRFVDSGTGRLRQVDVHAGGRLVTE